MEIRPVGASALLIEVADGPSVEAWRVEFTRLREAGRLRVDEIVPGARTILLDGVAEIDELARLLADRPPPAIATRTEGDLVTIPTWYDGPDLVAVAELWRMSPADVVTLHTTTDFRVAFCGFAPGFAYISGLPPELAVPRHATPRTRVPAGSVALADAYCGVYPTASPGGWHLIGRTDIVLFDVTRPSPALLSPGVRVRFSQVAP